MEQRSESEGSGLQVATASLLFCCFPVGLGLMWWKNVFTKPVRIGLTIGVLVVWSGMAMSGARRSGDSAGKEADARAGNYRAVHYHVDTGRKSLAEAEAKGAAGEFERALKKAAKARKSAQAALKLVPDDKDSAALLASAIAFTKRINREWAEANAAADAQQAEANAVAAAKYEEETKARLAAREFVKIGPDQLFKALATHKNGEELFDTKYQSKFVRWTAKFRESYAELFANAGDSVVITCENLDPSMPPDAVSALKKWQVISVEGRLDRLDPAEEYGDKLGFVLTDCRVK